MSDLAALFTRAFADVHPGLRFEATASPAGHVDVAVTELGEDGALRGRVEQSLDLSRLLTEPRAAAFFEGCARAARQRAEAPPDAGSFLDWFTPSDLLPTLLLDAQELATPEAFAAALREPWGVLARLQTRALCRELADELPAAIAAVRLDDDEDLQLVDALFALFSDRYATRRAMDLLRRTAETDRRHLAPLLVGFLDKTASDEDFKTNAYFLEGKRTPNPVCPDVAFRILTRWGVPLGDRAERWARAGAISPALLGVDDEGRPAP